MTLYYIILHYILLHYVTLHCITLLCILSWLIDAYKTQIYMSYNFICTGPLHILHIKLKFSKDTCIFCTHHFHPSHGFILHFITLHNIVLFYITFHSITLHNFITVWPNCKLDPECFFCQFVKIVRELSRFTILLICSYSQTSSDSLNYILGPLTIAVHPSWAPLGAGRFLEMVDVKFFSSKIAMFRALENFLVQVGKFFWLLFFLFSFFLLFYF